MHKHTHTHTHTHTHKVRSRIELSMENRVWILTFTQLLFRRSETTRESVRESFG